MARRPADDAGVRAALRDPVLRVYFAGQAISATGSWMNQVALGWLALELTGSALAIGVVMAARTIPIFILSLPAGVIADRFDRARLIVAMSAVATATYGALAALTQGGLIDLPLLVVLAALAGCAQAIEIPALHAFIGQAAGPARMMSVVALNAVVFNGARVVGPAIAGVIVATSGSATVFALNAISYLPLMVGLLVVSVPFRAETTSGTGRHAIGEAISFVRREPRVALLLALLAANTVVGTGYLVLAPAVAAALDAGPEGVGLLLSGAGVGAVVAGVAMARTSARTPRHRILLVAGIAAFVGQFGVAVADSVSVSVALTAVAGGGMVAYTASSNASIQMLTPNALRGRLMSFYALVVPGLVPLGSLFIGVMAEAWTIRIALGIGATIWLVALLTAFARSSAFRSL